MSTEKANAETPNLKNLSVLSQGNTALRDKQFASAVAFYLKALERTPGLAKAIAPNLAMARRQYKAEAKASGRIRVGVCGWELSHNAAGRVYTLAKLYETFADVEIIGCILSNYGKALWEPLRGTAIPIHSVFVEQESRFFEQALELVTTNPYDVVHLSKPRAPNLFIGALYKLIWDARVIVDIDDEELSFVGCDEAIGVEDYLNAHGSLPPMTNLGGPDWTRLAVGLANKFDGLTVSNPVLQRRYGGQIVRHARDEKIYRPSPELKRRSRDHYGVDPNKKVVLFFGTPREHKGLLHVADAIASLNRTDVVFAIIGDFQDATLKKRLLEKPGVDYFFLGNQPFDKIPDIVAVGDFCVLLQDHASPVAQFQVPAKLSDAMAMGLAVMASDSGALADLSPNIAFISVDRSGVADQLSKLLDDEDYAKTLREAAQAVFAAELSLSANLPKLQAALSTLPEPPNRTESARHLLLLLKQTPLAYLTKHLFNCDKGATGQQPLPAQSQSPQASEPPTPEWHQRECVARLEVVNLHSATGWALATGNSSDKIILRLDLNSHPLHLVDTYRLRNDVKKAHGGDGYAGYHGELTEYLDFSGSAKISAQPISHRLTHTADRKGLVKNYPLLFKGKHFSDINRKARQLADKLYWPLRFLSTNNTLPSGLVSVIILNRNGLRVLKRCLESLLEHSKIDLEVIVVDHDSTDGSIEYIKSLSRDNVRGIYRDKNYSFSDSNNLAANVAQGDILVFLNNDIIMADDAVGAMVDVVRKTDFGLVGIKLWDMPQGVPESVCMSMNVVQHVGVHFRGTCRSNVLEAFETRPGSCFRHTADLYETPAVTAAMMAIRKADFVTVGGFDHAYFYGQEDVDFCLRYMRAGLGKTGVLLTHGVYHARGLSRRVLSTANNSYLSDNRAVLQQKMGAWFRRQFRKDQLSRSGYWNQKPYSIAMIVSDIGFETDKADYFTARELGDAIEECTTAAVGYFSAQSKEVDVSGYDAVIVYIDGFDVARLTNVSPCTLLIAWARNWFPRWCERPWINAYDLILASSEFACAYMEEALQRRVDLLRIAAAKACVDNPKGNDTYLSDYCFTGSFFNSPRDICAQLNPREIPFEFKLFGHNWDGHPSFGDYTRGPVSYQDIPSVYASTKLVVDDANIATKDWGALNCRVYDALAAGAMCVTNNQIGTQEIFGNEFPVYDCEGGLRGQLLDLLSDEAKRTRLTNKYRRIVLDRHTYYHRSKELFRIIEEEHKRTSIAIKICAPTLAKSKPWGDLYFAIALRKHLARNGYKVRIDCLDEWHSQRALGDDVVIALRGLDRYKPLPNQLNILWIISHPDMISEAEIRDYDKTYVASERYRDLLVDFIGIDSIQFLPQATDFSVDELDRAKLAATPSHDMLFIGNSRGQYREVVRWSVENDLPLAVYGQGWQGLIPDSFIAGDHLNNLDIPYYYRNARVVLNDHWPDMRRRGFISNRVLDVLGIGGTVLSDFVAGMESLSHPRLFTYNCETDFVEIAKRCCSKPNSSSDNVDYIRRDTGFTLAFADRCKTISSYIEANLADGGIL